MVQWRGKSIDTLSESELKYALEDAVEALTSNKNVADEDKLFFGLLLGATGGALVAAFAIALATII